MADKTVKVKYDAEIEEVLASIKKMTAAHGDALGDMEQQAKQSGEKMSDLLKGSFLGSFAGNIAAEGMNLVTSAISSVGEAMIGGNAEIETYQASFETLLGSSEKASGLLSKLKDLGAATPFEFPELAESGRNLAAFGFDADKIPDILRRVGDVASGVNAPIGELSELFGKAKVSGTLYAEDINQLVGRGIPVIGEFAKILGVSESQVKKMASEGKVSYATLEQALVNMTDEGGKFSGMMEKQSQGFEGLQSTAEDALGEIGRKIGRPLFDAAKQGLIGVLEWMQSPKTQEALDNVAAGIEKISSLFDSEGEEMVRLGRKQQELFQKQIQYNESRMTELRTVGGLKDEYEKLAGKQTLTADEQERMKQITSEMNGVYPGLIGNTDTYKESLDKMRTATDEANASIVELTGNNQQLARAMMISAQVAARGEAKKSWDSLNDSVKEYNDRFSTTVKNATEAASGGGLQGKIAGFLTSVFTDADAKTADFMAKDLINQSGDAVGKLSKELLRLQQANVSDPKISYIQSILGSLTEYSSRKDEVAQLKQDLADLDAGLTKPVTAGGGTGKPDPAAIDDKAAKEAERKRAAAFAAAMSDLKRKEEIELLNAQLVDASEAQLADIRASYQQQRIDAAKKYAQESVDLEHDATTASLKLQLAAHKKELELADAAAAAQEERAQQTKDFIDEIQKDVDGLDIDIVPGIEADAKALAEAAQQAKEHRAAVANVFADIQTVAGEGNAAFKTAAIGRASIATYESANAAYSATVGIPFVGPVLAVGAAAAAILAGMKNVQNIAGIKLSKGGMLNKPTFALAGEDGPELVGSLRDLIPIFREAVLGKQQRRTKIGTGKRQGIDVRLGVAAFGRGSRSAQLNATRGAF